MEKSNNQKREEGKYDSKVKPSENNLDYGEGNGQFERSTGNRGTQSHQGRYGKWNKGNRKTDEGFDNFNQSGGYGDARKVGKGEIDSSTRDELKNRAMMGRRDYEIRDENPTQRKNERGPQSPERKDQGYDFLNLGY